MPPVFQCHPIVFKPVPCETIAPDPSYLLPDPRSDYAVPEGFVLLIATNKLIAVGLAVFAAISGTLIAIFANHANKDDED